MSAVLRVVTDHPGDLAADGRATAIDPRDPSLYRSGLASARAALRQGVARRHDRESVELDPPRAHDGALVLEEEGS
jgi:hypothetical protein